MQEIVQRLKRKHRRIYSTIVGSLLLIWRPLGRQEYREILQLAEGEHDLQERICQVAVLWPEDLDFRTYVAGVPSVLAPQIKEQSGYGSPAKAYAALDEYRTEMAAFEHQAEAAIAAAFPRISFKQMRAWTIDDLMWHLVRAEWVLKNIQGREVEFRSTEPEEPETVPSPVEAGQQMRADGIDPMSTLDPKSLRPGFAELPFIGGTNWQDEVNWNGIQQQVQKLLERGEAIPEDSPE